MTRLAFPLAVSPLGRSVAVEYGDPAHIRQMLELLIFTMPTERVMRPDLCTPARQMIFAPLGGARAMALEAAVQAAVEQWLGTVLTLLDLTVSELDQDGAVEIALTYELSLTLAREQATFRKVLT